MFDRNSNLELVEVSWASNGYLLLFFWLFCKGHSGIDDDKFYAKISTHKTNWYGDTRAIYICEFSSLFAIDDIFSYRQMNCAEKRDTHKHFCSVEFSPHK